MFVMVNFGLIYIFLISRMQAKEAAFVWGMLVLEREKKGRDNMMVLKISASGSDTIHLPYIPLPRRSPMGNIMSVTIDELSYQREGW